MVTAINLLAGFGALSALPHLYRLASSIWLYYLRPSSIGDYLHPSVPYSYALVTGATDGIGKGTATELLRRGFNLILHGRNEAKMQKVIQELRARVPERPQADIRYFLADVSLPNLNIEQLIAPFTDLHITLVIHNVGGAYIDSLRLDERPESDITALVYKNALFPLFLTRVLLPYLRRSARSGPVNVQFVGSLTGDIAPSHIPIYGATKSFLQGLTRGLDNDEQYIGEPSGVRFTYLVVGGVRSENHQVPAKISFITPDSDTFGKAVVARTGCGRRRVTPYVNHAIASYLIGFMSDSIVDSVTAQEMHGIVAEAEKTQ